MKPLEVTEIFGCPYCGTERGEDSIGCCGESSAHFEHMYYFTESGDEATFDDFKAYEDSLEEVKSE